MLQLQKCWYLINNSYAMLSYSMSSIDRGCHISGAPVPLCSRLRRESTKVPFSRSRFPKGYVCSISRVGLVHLEKRKRVHVFLIVKHTRTCFPRCAGAAYPRNSAELISDALHWSGALVSMAKQSSPRIWRLSRRVHFASALKSLDWNLIDYQLRSTFRNWFHNNSYHFL